MPSFVAALSTPDTIVLVMCLVLAVRGAFKGFTWQLVRTLGLIGAIWVAGWLYQPVGEWLDARLDVLPSDWNPIAAWLLIVVGAWLLATFVAYMARGVIRTAELTTADRVLGFGLGAVMGLAFATVAFVVYGRVADEEQLQATLEDSHSARLMAELLDVAEPLIPAAVAERWGETFDALKQAGELLPGGE